MGLFEVNQMISHAMNFQQQIRRKQEESKDRSWTWEAYLPGPISSEDVELIMAIAGCWCCDPAMESVRFYVNQNHPNWSEDTPLYFWKGGTHGGHGNGRDASSFDTRHGDSQRSVAACTYEISGSSCGRKVNRKGKESRR